VAGQGVPEKETAIHETLDVVVGQKNRGLVRVDEVEDQRLGDGARAREISKGIELLFDPAEVADVAPEVEKVLGLLLAKTDAHDAQGQDDVEREGSLRRDEVFLVNGHSPGLLVPLLRVPQPLPDTGMQKPDLEAGSPAHSKARTQRVRQHAVENHLTGLQQPLGGLVVAEVAGGDKDLVDSRRPETPNKGEVHESHAAGWGILPEYRLATGNRLGVDPRRNGHDGLVELANSPALRLGAEPEILDDVAVALQRNFVEDGIAKVVTELAPGLELVALEVALRPPELKAIFFNNITRGNLRVEIGGNPSLASNRKKKRKKK